MTRAMTHRSPTRKRMTDFGLKTPKKMPFPKRYLIIILFFTLLFGNISGSPLCPSFDIVANSEEMDGKIRIGNYSCPGLTDPKLHTECCNAPGMRGCCPKTRYFYEIDRTLASIIAITVTSSCVVFAILMAVCCFWSRCFLYSACRAEFTHDIATYESKEDSIDMDTMPTEFSIKSTNKFSPVVVSNGNLPLDAEAT